MWRLFHFPLCPFSRKLRLFLSEKGIPFELQRVVAELLTARMRRG